MNTSNHICSKFLHKCSGFNQFSAHLLTYGIGIRVIVRLILLRSIQAGEVFFQEQTQRYTRRHLHVVFKTHPVFIKPVFGCIRGDEQGDFVALKRRLQAVDPIFRCNGVNEGLFGGRAKSGFLGQITRLAEGLHLGLCKAITDKITFDADFHI